MRRKIYAAIASLINARYNCAKSSNQEWFEKHSETIKQIVKDHGPSGSGIDCGTRIDLENSTEYKLIFTFGYHHMNDGGYYDGWTDHKAIVRPSLAFGYELTITGRNRNDVKDYLHDCFTPFLDTEIEN